MGIWKGGNGMWDANILRNGASSLPVDMLPMLERFQIMFLWMYSDEAGKSVTEKFARKLGMRRFHIVNPYSSTTNITKIKDENDWLRKSEEGFTNIIIY